MEILYIKESLDTRQMVYVFMIHEPSSFTTLHVCVLN